jgi:CubicO group peptidase (beta-lactamase class C family)
MPSQARLRVVGAHLRGNRGGGPANAPTTVAPSSTARGSDSDRLAPRMAPEKYAALKAFAERRLEETKVPGAGVSMIKDGEVVFAGGFGTRDTNTGEPIDAQTAYLIGSSTKPFTTTAIAILAQVRKTPTWPRSWANFSLF